MSTTRALVHLPPRIGRGDIVEVRTTLAHAMETGYRRGSDGQMLPRDIVRRLEVTLAGTRVFAADLHPAIAANPYIAFALRVDGPGTLQLTWTGDNGFAHRETVQLDPV